MFERQDFVIAGYFGEGEGAAKTYAMCCVLKPDPPCPAEEVEADGRGALSERVQPRASLYDLLGSSGRLWCSRSDWSRVITYASQARKSAQALAAQDDLG